MRLSIAFAALALAAPPAISASSAQPAAADGSAATRVNPLIEAMRGGQWAALNRFIDANVAPAAVDEARELIGSIAFINGRFGVDSVASPAPNQAVITYRSQYTGRPGAFLVEFDPNAPSRIARVAAQPTPAEAVAVPASEAERLKKIDTFARSIADANIFSGVVLVAKDGKPIYQRAFGKANRNFDVPNSMDTKLNLGSMNKMFTSIAIGQLMEAGKLSLDDPLSKYLPDFPDPESAKKIKLKHLLSHTSGLNSYFNDEYWRSSPSRFRDVASYMEVARSNAKMEFEPGTRWSYSNTGMLVLGRIVELVSGMDYYDYIHKNIYDPVGMPNTGSFEADLVVPKLASTYQYEFGREGPKLRSGIYITPARGAPAGGGYSTVGDLLRLANALRAGRLLKPETLKLFASAKPELNSPGYGYGFFIAYQGPKGRNIIGHPGGFGDGTCASLAMIEDSDRLYTAVILSNGLVERSCLGLINYINQMFPAKAAVSRAAS